MTPAGLNISLPNSNYNILVSNPSFTVNDQLYVTAPRKDGNSLLTVSDSRTSPAYEQSV